MLIFSPPDFKFLSSPVLNSKRLEFEFLDKNNYQIINSMFCNDDSPFTEPFYKNKKDLEKYFELYQTTRIFRGRDWLIKTINNQEYIGVFHAFDFSRETVNNRNKRCSIGFAIKPESRRKYYASEATMHIVNHIFTNMPIAKILACTDIKNLATCNLLENLNFKFNANDYEFSDIVHHFTITKNESVATTTL